MCKSRNKCCISKALNRLDKSIFMKTIYCKILFQKLFCEFIFIHYQKIILQYNKYINTQKIYFIASILKP